MIDCCQAFARVDGPDEPTEPVDLGVSAEAWRGRSGVARSGSGPVRLRQAERSPYQLHRAPRGRVRGAHRCVNSSARPQPAIRRHGATRSAAPTTGRPRGRAGSSAFPRYSVTARFARDARVEPMHNRGVRRGGRLRGRRSVRCPTPDPSNNAPPAAPTRRSTPDRRQPIDDHHQRATHGPCSWHFEHDCPRATSSQGHGSLPQPTPPRWTRPPTGLKNPDWHADQQCRHVWE